MNDRWIDNGESTRSFVFPTRVFNVANCYKISNDCVNKRDRTLCVASMICRFSSKTDLRLGRIHWNKILLKWTTLVSWRSTHNSLHVDEQYFIIQRDHSIVNRLIRNHRAKKTCQKKCFISLSRRTRQIINEISTSSSLDWLNRKKIRIVKLNRTFFSVLFSFRRIFFQIKFSLHGDRDSHDTRLVFRVT